MARKLRATGRRRDVRGTAPLSIEDLEHRILPTLLGTQLFPTDYPWNQNIASAPVASNSAAVISHIGGSIGIHPDWGEDKASNGNAPLYGIPYNVVHGNSVAKINVVIDNYPGESDIVGVPIPANAVIEGDFQNGPNPNGAGYNNGQRGDSHLLIWDEDNDIAYELYGVSRPTDAKLFPNKLGVELAHTDGLWHAAQESVWHMTADQFRALGATSADAAGLSILAGLARPEEGLPTSQGGQGVINHALRFTLPSGDVSQQYIYPASHMVSASSNSLALPLGARLRLMNTPDIDAIIQEMGPEAAAIATAMQQYGLVLADIGSAMYVTGASASENANGAIAQVWDMNDVLGLTSLTASDFQVVNLTPVVTGLSQTSGAGGTTITITGQNFSGSAGHLSVFFGTLASPTVTYVDNAHIKAVVPAGAGTVNVTVQSGVNETDTISDSPTANATAPIFGYGTSATNANDLFTFSASLPATHLSASAATSTAAGTMFGFTVTALDVNGGTAAGFGGTVHFTSTDPLASLPADYTFKPGDFGVHTFQITAGTVGGQNFTVSDTPDGLGSAGTTLTVTPGTVSLSKSTAMAASTTIQVGKTSTITLTARDGFGNQETSGGLMVAFGFSGTGAGTFGPVMDNGDGTYKVVFSATSAGSVTITATIGGRAVTSQLPMVTVSPDMPPVIQAINPITLPYYQFPDVVTVQASSPVGNPLTYSVATFGDSLLFDLQQQYKFTGVSYATAGATAYLLHSNQTGPGVMGYYLIRPSDGALFAYDGSGSFAHSFAMGMPLATLGPNVFTDPMLLMNAMPPANYSGLQALEQQFQFTGVGYRSTTVAGMMTPAYVLHSVVSGPGVNGFYLIRSSDGAVFPYDGSGSYAHSFATGTSLGTIGATLYSFPSELLNAQAAPSLYSQLYQVDQKLDLQVNGGFHTNLFGNQAQWLFSPVLNQYGQHWYTLTLSGGQSVLRAWQGYQDSAVGAVVATFATPAVYNNPMLLTSATFMPNPATASITSAGSLTIGLANPGFVGSFKVIVTVSDGILSTSQTVTVTSTDTAPALTVTQNSATVMAGSTLSVPHGSFPLNDTTTVASAGNQPVTTTASVSSYSQLFNLEQQLRLQFLGNIMAGTTADVFAAAGMNKFGNPYYVLSPAGVLYAYDGSNNYATSFMGTPVATLGASVYQDPMLLTNAQPPVNYAQLKALETQYQFMAVGPAMGVAAQALHSNQPGPGAMGFYLLTPNGNIYAYDGSGNLATTLANSANIIATVDPGVFVNPALLTNATVSPGMYPLLQQTEQKFDLQALPDGFHTGLMGNAAKWLFSPVMNSQNQHFYTLVLSPNGTQALLYAWDGGSKAVPTGAMPVAVLDPSVYANPMLLLNAKAPEAATGVTVNGGTTSVPVNGMLTLAAPTSFVGSFQVTVTTTDGALTTTQTFQEVSTDTAPVPNTIANQTASKSGSPLQVMLGSTDAENDSVSYTVQAVGYNAAFNLQQQYQFTAVGLFATMMGGMTTQAFVLHSNVLGGVGGFYLINPSNGGVYAYDGSGNYATTFANPANLIATLSPSVFTNPMLLTNAMAPSAPNAMVSVTGNMLTVNVAGVAPGTVFQVLVTANDGAETTRTSFLVTVTA
jgi:hypothetical protein